MLAAIARAQHVGRLEHIALAGNLRELHSGRMRVRENTLEHLNTFTLFPELVTKIGDLIVKTNGPVSSSDECLAGSALAGQEFDLADQIDFRIADGDGFA